MTTYNVIYETENFYTHPVKQAVLELMVLPENSSSQNCQSIQIHNSLEVIPDFSESLYGARVIRFTIPRKFCFVKIKVQAIVEKIQENPFEKVPFYDFANHELMFSDDFKISFFRWLSSNDFTRLKNEKLPEETNWLKNESQFDYVRRMTFWVYKNVIFQAGITTTQTILDEIVKIRKGVCQDHAHLMIAIMRANGIPARYVSGYLHQGLNFKGDLAMHAWTEVYFPNSGWIGFDPSNNLLSDANYLKVSHGLDYTDCMPIKGILVANGNNSTEYTVKVTEQQTQ